MPRGLQVWLNNAEDEEREGVRKKNKEVTGVAMGTRPTVFKWKLASPDRQDVTTWKIGNGGLDAVQLVQRQHAQMLPCTCTPRTTSNRYKQITATTTGEDK